ncbi:MAG TPA: hypothetical protein VFQ68_16195 [Streptosporangiaceae bacterium]|nr:hypothetical protein [Streptosporangiaceae bacterium]
MESGIEEGLGDKLQPGTAVIIAVIDDDDQQQGASMAQDWRAHRASTAGSPVGPSAAVPRPVVADVAAVEQDTRYFAPADPDDDL